MNFKSMSRGSSKFFRMFLVLIFLGICTTLTYAQHLSQKIRLNQIGYYPGGPKIAVLDTNVSGPFYITSPDLRDTLFHGKLSSPHHVSYSPEITRFANFSNFKRNGIYVVNVPGIGYSYEFKIGASVEHNLAKGALKAYYYIRASTPLPVKYAGKWARDEGHPDTVVYIHPSAAGPHRPAGTVISTPKGWYDAGDYNKYVVNSGITMGTLFSAYEDFPAYFDTLRIKIPEDGDQVPDILNQALWNLRWMLSMQDPNDGGVYHKTTTAHFEPFIMPDQAHDKRYVVQKSTAATLDFAAVMAQASRILKKYQKELPGLSDSCLTAAKKAWIWAQKHPDDSYNQRKMNRKFNPKITTGAYGDSHLKDEFIWAACELYVTTGNIHYINKVNILPDDRMPLPGWGRVRLLGYYTLLRFRNTLGPAVQNDIPIIKKRLIKFANQLMNGAQNDLFGTVMGKKVHDFVWGSNSVDGNQGIALIQAYLLTGRKKYLNAALANLDYLLGRNGTGYSFITGYGSKSPMHPHHRISASDGIRLPIPGLLVGGANPGQQDGCGNYPSKIPDQSYVDNDCDYAANEIAINWNAPLVYVTNAIEALQYRSGYSRK